MVIEHKVLPLYEQDQLNEGLLKTEEGEYVEMLFSSALIDNSWKKFADDDEQDRLKEGLIKIEERNYGGYYVSIDKIEKVREEDKEDCFIATAVYGNVQANQVNILRDYRDRVLIKNPFGKLLTKMYYSGVGKKGAKFIKEQMPSSIPAIRKGLDFLVNMHSKNY